MPERFRRQACAGTRRSLAGIVVGPAAGAAAARAGQYVSPQLLVVGRRASLQPRRVELRWAADHRAVATTH
jgi:hypothetical protein